MPNSLPAHRSYTRPRQPKPKPVRLRRRLATLTGLGLAGLLAGLLSGCSTTPSSSSVASNSVPSFAALAGNWLFRSATTASAAHLNSLAGSLAVQGAAVTGTLHPATAGQCLAPTEIVSVTGGISTDGILTLSGQTAGTTITLSGSIAPDRHSLESPTLTATGGACLAANPALIARAPIPRDDGFGTTAQQYQPVSGTYTGTLTTAEGETFPLSTAVTQLDQPDSTGIYHLQGTAGTAGAPANPCLPAAVAATASTLSGGTLAATFSDNAGTSLTATGTASPDATTLTLTNWQITSPCGTESGTAVLTRQ